MEVQPLPSVPGLPEFRILRLDDSPECLAVKLALRNVNSVILRRDKPLWHYLSLIVNREASHRIITTAAQLGRIIGSLDQMVEATRQMGELDGENELRKMAETIRPYAELARTT